MKRLVDDKDSRATGNGDVWETYPRYDKLRWFPKPQWAVEHPEMVPETPWLEKRRPKSEATPGSSSRSENEINNRRKRWLERESNPRHEDFQSSCSTN